MSKKIYGSLDILDKLSVTGTISSLGKTVPLQITINGTIHTAEQNGNIDISSSINTATAKYVLKAGDTMSGTLTFSNPSTNVYDIISLNNNPTDSKKYLRKFRSSNPATIWHETVEGGKYRLATGSTDTRTALLLTENGELWIDGARTYTTSFKPSAGDIGALPITGGNLNGTLTINSTVPNALAIVGDTYPGLVLRSLSLSAERNKVIEVTSSGDLNVITRDINGSNNGVITIPKGIDGTVYTTGNPPSTSSIGALALYVRNYGRNYCRVAIPIIPLPTLETDRYELSRLKGTLQFKRGGNGSTNRTETILIDAQSSYATAGVNITKTLMYSGWSWKIKQFLYKGAKWIGLVSDSENCQDFEISFYGIRDYPTFGNYSGADQLVPISIKRTADPNNPDAILNEEIYNSLQDVSTTNIINAAGYRYVSEDWKINNKTMRENLVLSAGDVGALPITGGTLSGQLNCGLIVSTDRITANEFVSINNCDFRSDVTTRGNLTANKITCNSITGQFVGKSAGPVDLNSLYTTVNLEWGYNNVNGNSPNIFPATNNANGVLTFNTHVGDYGHQIGLSSNGKLYHRWWKDAVWSEIYTTANKPDIGDITGAMIASVENVTTQDWNNLTTAGSYCISNASGANFPSIVGHPTVYNFGTLFVQNTYNSITQVYIPEGRANIYIRNRWSASWREWKVVQSEDSIPIESSFDLDNLTLSGNYNLYRGSGVTFTNCPSDFDFGTLQVIGRGTAARSFVTQILTWRSNGRQMIRTRNDGAMAWTQWSRIYSDSQKPSIGDIGGGTLGAQLFIKCDSGQGQLTLGDGTGNYSTIFRNDGSSFYIISTPKGQQDGTWNQFRPFVYDMNNGNVELGNGTVRIDQTSNFMQANNIKINSQSGSWIGMKDQQCLSNLNVVQNASASAIIRQEHSDHYFILGGLGNSQFGMYLINKNRTANGTDASLVLGVDGVVNGSGNASFNDVYIRSDKRLKTNLVKLESTLDKLSNINAYYYDKRMSLDTEEYNSHEMGLIAQDVLEYFPEAVSYGSDANGNRVLVISNAAINATLVSAVNELHEENIKLKERLDKIEKLLGL